MKYYAIIFFISCLLAGCGGRQSLRKTLEGSVIDAKGNEVTADYALNNDYLLLYFSAHWCPPCQAFTPKLVEFYKENHGGLLFQILFISNDRTEIEMRNYMKETGMPWPAVTLHSRATKKLQKQYSGDGIPRLVLLNKSGDIVADSFKGKRYIGPQSVLAELEKRISKRKIDPPGLSETTGEDLPPPKKLIRKYDIEGIGRKATGMVVLIDGKTYIVGDTLPGDAVITDITDTDIEIDIEGNRYRLKPQ